MILFVYQILETNTQIGTEVATVPANVHCSEALNIYYLKLQRVPSLQHVSSPLHPSQTTRNQVTFSSTLKISEPVVSNTSFQKHLC